MRGSNRPPFGLSVGFGIHLLETATIISSKSNKKAMGLICPSPFGSLLGIGKNFSGKGQGGPHQEAQYAPNKYEVQKKIAR